MAAISGFDNCRFFPLYRYSETMGQEEKTPNLDPAIYNVPQEAWDAYIGGYQPAQKWLKDRKGRVLMPYGASGVSCRWLSRRPGL